MVNFIRGRDSGTIFLSFSRVVLKTRLWTTYIPGQLVSVVRPSPAGGRWSRWPGGEGTNSGSLQRTEGETRIYKLAAKVFDGFLLLHFLSGNLVVPVHFRMDQLN